MDLLNSGKRQSKDVVSPYKLSLLVMIKQVCDSKNLLRKNATDASIPWFDDNRQRREFALATLEFIQGPDLEIKQFLSDVKANLSESLYTVFINLLRWNSSNGISGLMDLIQSLETLLVVEPNNITPVVHKSSVIGLFLRHMMLAFDKLSFGQMTKLYYNFEHYCLSLTRDESLTNYQDSSLIKFDDAIPTSRRQAELFVARQVARLQINEKAALSPPELQKRLRHLLTANPSLAEAHFLSLMNCLRVREYCGAIHSIYRAFDCATVEDFKGDETSKNFRFAALNLGSLLCRFGFKEEATLAIREAMTMAREANDNVCLQHALVWSYRLATEGRDVLIERSITKSGELSLPYLASIGILTFSQMKANTPSNPSQVFEFLRKCDQLNYVHSLLELTTQSYAQRISLWNLYGKKQMVFLTTQLLLYLNTSEPTCRGLYYSGEAVCRGFCQMAILLSKEGKFDQAVDVLNLAKEQFPSHTAHAGMWMFTEQLLNYDHALWQGKWNEAEFSATNLAVFDSCESQIRKAEILLYKGELSLASEILEAIIGRADIKDPEFKVRVYMLQGNCFCHANAPSMAILPLNKALTLAKQFHLKYHQDMITLHLANVQYLMDYFNKALQLLDSIKVNILAHGSLIEQGKLKLLRAKCLIKKANSLVENRKQIELAAATFEFGDAVENFLKVQALFLAKDAAYREALVYNLIGQNEKRNKSALQFRQLDQLCGSTTLTINEIL